MATVDLTVAADLSTLKRQLAEIPGITSDVATKMAADLNKSIKAAEKASKQAAAASKSAAEAAKRAGDDARDALDTASASASKFGDKAGALGSNAGKLAGVLDLLVPGAGGAARAVADMADAGEVAAASATGLGVSLSSVLAVLAPVGIAVAALGGAWHYFSSELEAAEAANKRASDRATEAATAAAEWAKKQSEVGDAFGVASGSVEKQTILIRKSNAEIDAAAEAQRKLLTAQRDLEKGKLTGAFGEDASAFKAAQAALSAFETQVQTTKDRNELLITSEEEKAKAARKAATDSLAAAAAARARAEAESDLVKMLAAVEEQENKVLAQNASYLTSLRSLEEAARTATEARLTGEAAVEAQLQRQAEKINEVAARQVEASVGNAGQLASIERARVDALVALEAEAAQKIDGIHEAAHQKRIEEMAAELAERRRVTEATASASASLFGSIADAAGTAAEEQGKSNKDAALQLFAVQKAAAIAEGAVNTALAVSSALTLPPPASFIAAAAAGVAGAAQVAAIASSPPPSFADTPGVMQMSSRGAVSLAAGDYFAAAKDPGELQRQAGAMGAPSVSILEMRLGHRVLDRSVAQTIRQGGRLSRELARTSHTGPTGHAVRA
jgi:hypothetical protein